MSFASSKTVIRGAIGTELRVRATVLDAITQAAKDLHLYSVTFGIKTAADETSTYVLSPVAGTTSASGYLDVTIPAASMTMAAGTYVGEFCATLAGAATIRVQMPVVVSGRVIV